MNIKDKRLVVFHQMEQETEPINLVNLLKKLGDGYNKRSVQRWLADMAEKGFIQKQGFNRDIKYRSLRGPEQPIVKIDEIRVCYRQQRRSLIRKIILNKLTGKPLQDYIASQAPILVKNNKEEEGFFIEDTLEDLRELKIDSIRIAGLGVTLDELEAWRSAQES